MGSSVAASSSSQIKAKTQKTPKQLNMPHQLKAEEVQQDAPVVEATPSAADCEDLSLRSLLAVESQCKYSSQMFALGSPTSANIHPDFLCIYRSSICYIHADN